MINMSPLRPLLAAALMLAGCTSQPRLATESAHASEPAPIPAYCTQVLDTPAVPNPYYRYLITQPGYYCLSHDLEPSSATPELALVAIINDASGAPVTLDLLGHTLHGSQGGGRGAGQGILVMGADVTVRNGRVRGFEHAVLVTSGLGRDYERPLRDGASGRIELTDHGMVFEGLVFSANRHNFTLNAIRDERSGQNVTFAYMLAEFVHGVSQCSAQHAEIAAYQGDPLQLAFEALAPASELAQRDPRERRFYLRAMASDEFRLTLSSLQLLNFVAGGKTSARVCEHLARAALTLQAR